jgi:probable F420-dependent oxidoreductase
MKLGALFPQSEIGDDPLVIRDFVQAVEDLGYDYLSVYENVTGANPDRPGGWDADFTCQDPTHTPLILFGYLAGLTKSLKFLTNVMVLPSRQTVLVAKQAAEVDILSGGRLRLGVAVGWNPLEYQAMGVDFHMRGKRIEEQIVVLRQLWTKPLVKFNGQFHQLDDTGINPLPLQRPIPIWMGGVADPVLRRAARLGEGWLPPVLPAELAVEMVTRLRRYLEEAGRKPEKFGMRCRLDAGMPSEWVTQLEMWRDLGATHAELITTEAGLKMPEGHIEVLRRFKDAVIA